MNKNVMCSISREQFSLKVMTTRDVDSYFLYHEIEWYEAINIDLIGMIAVDITDENFCVMLMANNNHNQYRALDWKMDFLDIDEARKWLEGKISQYTLTKDIQVEEDSLDFDLFESKVNTSKLNPSFVRISKTKAHLPARKLIKALTYNFKDVDGNFIKDFQTTGFDARIWELYLHSFLIENKFQIDKQYNRPDFVCSKWGVDIAIEAVTVGRNKDNKPSNIIIDNKDKLLMQLNYTDDQMAIRFGSPLFSKLQKNYQELPQVKDKPLIFAIADFYEEQSMTFSQNSIIEYLYGCKHISFFIENNELCIIPKKIVQHQSGEKVIPSGFFFTENTEHISGVLFSNSGTISKFNRIGLGAGFGNNSLAIIQLGVAHKHDPNSRYPVFFRRVITHNSGVETWCEGMNLYHNPNALNPIPTGLFENIAEHSYNDGQIESIIPEKHPYFSNSLLMQSNRD